MGHVTTVKGASRFDVASGWGGKTPDRMKVRGYCSYKVTMPPGKSFAGEKLLMTSARTRCGPWSTRGLDCAGQRHPPEGAAADQPRRHGAGRQQLQPVPRLDVRRSAGSAQQFFSKQWPG